MKDKIFIALLITIMFSGCAEKGGEVLTKLNGKNVLFIVAQQNFRDEELSKPKQILEKEGAKVKVASITREQAIGMLGMKIIPELAVRDANPNEFDALVIVGGSGSPKLAEYPEVINILKKFKEQEKPIAAICLAPYVLAKAGILEGKNVTLYPADFAIAEIRRAKANYVEKPVVVDGRIITADGPQSAEMFGNEIVNILSK
ncbi:MAG: DJ-1/PfpI family protein [Candidatus Aenigmatarchaeota archaeon]